MSKKRNLRKRNPDACCKNCGIPVSGLKRGKGREILCSKCGKCPNCKKLQRISTIHDEDCDSCKRRKNPWPKPKANKGKSRKRSNAAKKAWKHRGLAKGYTSLKRKGSKHLTNKKRRNRHL